MVSREQTFYEKLEKEKFRLIGYEINKNEH